MEGSYNAKINKGPWSDACVKVLFFLPVEIPIVWLTGFLGHTVCLGLYHYCIEISNNTVFAYFYPSLHVPTGYNVGEICTEGSLLYLV